MKSWNTQSGDRENGKEAALGATGGKASDPSGQGADPEGTDAPALHQSRHAGKLPSPPRSHHG